MQRTVRELQVKDREWISKKASEGRKICQHYGFTSEINIIPTSLDKVFQAWWNDEANNRVAENEIVNCLGCLFGELLCKEFNSEWKIITDSFGTDLAVQVVTQDRTWDTFPLAFVAKRVKSSEDESGFFAAMESMFLRELEKGN